MISLLSTALLMTTNVAVTTGFNQFWTPVMQLQVTSTNPNTVYHVLGSAEITNDTHHNVNCVMRLAIKNNDQWDFISAGGGGNTTPSRHHELLSRNVYYQPVKNFSGKFYTVIRCVSSAAKKNDKVFLTSAKPLMQIFSFDKG